MASEEAREPAQARRGAVFFQRILHLAQIVLRSRLVGPQDGSPWLRIRSRRPPALVRTLCSSARPRAGGRGPPRCRRAWRLGLRCPARPQGPKAFVGPNLTRARWSASDPRLPSAISSSNRNASGRRAPAQRELLDLGREVAPDRTGPVVSGGNSKGRRPLQPPRAHPPRAQGDPPGEAQDGRGLPQPSAAKVLTADPTVIDRQGCRAVAGPGLGGAGGTAPAARRRPVLPARPCG